MRRLAWLFAALLACGGRNLDPPEAEAPSPTGAGGGDMGTGGAGATTSSSSSAGGGGSGGGGGGEGGSPPMPPMPLQCLACVGQQCPETVACVTDPACGQGLFCAVTECLAGGGPDLFCVADCFDGDLGAAADAVSAILCLQGTCGDACGDFLPF